MDSSPSQRLGLLEDKVSHGDNLALVLWIYVFVSQLRAAGQPANRARPTEMPRGLYSRLRQLLIQRAAGQGVL